MSFAGSPPPSGAAPGDDDWEDVLAALPPDPLEGVEIPTDDSEPPEWVDQPLVGSLGDVTLPQPVAGQPAEVMSAVFEWGVSSKVRRRAEAAEMAAMLAAEAVFRAEFTADFGDGAWFEGGLKCFLADAARIMDCGVRTAGNRLHLAHRAHDDLPAVWDLFTRGEVTQAQVSVVVGEAEGLDPEFVPAYDAAATTALLAHPGSRLQRVLARIRETVQARTADERYRTAFEQRHVALEPASDGMARLVLEGPVERLAAIHQAAHRASIAAHGHEGETRSIRALMYDVLEDVILDGFAIAAADIRDQLLAANPDRPQRAQAVPARPRVQATVILHVPVLTLPGHSDESPSIEGVGPISPAQANALCAGAPSFFRVLTHPVTGARMTLDRTIYSPPADLRRWIQIRDEYSRFPGSLTPAHLCDIDHVREWHDVGVTNDDNLVALSRDKHNLKSMGLYTVGGDPNGELTFTSPMGVEHTSTPRPPARPAPALPDDCPF